MADGAGGDVPSDGGGGVAKPAAAARAKRDAELCVALASARLQEAEAEATEADLACRPQAGDTLVEAAVKVLRTANPFRKALHSAEAVLLWHSGALPSVHSSDPDVRPDTLPPDNPARDATSPSVVAAANAPRRGRGGSLASRQALLHSLTHIEHQAIHLSWDIVARFGPSTSYAMPDAFYVDFASVACDETKHFLLLEQRLRAVGSHYGALPVHDGLWESAMETAGSLKARLAIEHCVHEARGLDILPQTIGRFRAAGDEESAKLLEEVIYPEEVLHCAAGIKWFKHLVCHEGQQHEEEQQPPQEDASSCSGIPELVTSGSTTSSTLQADPVVQEFHRVVRRHFHGNLKPPFNTAARAAAGFDRDWYEPLAVS